MKKTAILSIALVAFLVTFISSCNKEITFDYNISEHDVRVKTIQSSGTLIDSFTIKQEDIKAAFAAAKANFDQKKIKSMLAKGFKAKGKGNANLDGITGVSLFIKYAGSAERKQIANFSAIPAVGTSEVDLALHGTDLKDMLGDTDLVVIVEVYYDSPTLLDKEITLTKGTMAFNIKG